VETSGLGAGSLGQPHIMCEGLNIFGQGNVGQVMVVMHQGGGKWVQVASGASSLSRRVVGRCVACPFARGRWVGCRWWEGCQKLDEPFMPVLWLIECGRAARENVCCRVVFRGRVRRSAAQDMMLI